MEGRGKKSAASLSVASVSALPSRIEPPPDLTSAQANVWRAVAATKPVEWFDADTAPLLAEYCRAAVLCDLLAVQVEAAIAGGDPGELKAVLDMRDKESKRLLSIGTKLRLTNQSRYTPKAADTANRRAGSGGKPWQFGKG
jgi:hypothetical protein